MSPPSGAMSPPQVSRVPDHSHSRPRYYTWLIIINQLCTLDNINEIEKKNVFCISTTMDYYSTTPIININIYSPYLHTHYTRSANIYRFFHSDVYQQAKSNFATRIQVTCILRKYEDGDVCLPNCINAAVAPR